MNKNSLEVMWYNLRPCPALFSGHSPCGPTSTSAPAHGSERKSIWEGLSSTDIWRSLTSGDISEDCLNLNIVRPKNSSPHALLPVMLWIYGGAFIQGDTSLYNGTGIVARGVARGSPVMFVSINYRVGPWGFPQGIAAAEADALNLGLKDQVVAMQWVKYNIRAFGGDPDKVTLFGQSAGAASIQIHYYNLEGIDDLFRAAIMQSPSTVPFFNSSIREPIWDLLSVSAGCASGNKTQAFECLRLLPESAFLNASLPFFDISGDAIRGGDYPFVPVVDGKLIPDMPSNLVDQGRFIRKPLLAGTNQDEGTAFAPFGLNTSHDFISFLDQNTSPLAATQLNASLPNILQLYPDDPSLYSPFIANDTFPYGKEFKRAASVVGDAAFLAPLRHFAHAAAKFGMPVFAYRFSAPDSVTNISLGVTHGAELPFIFGSLINPSPSSVQLSTAMENYWISFASDLIPRDYKDGHECSWPLYSEGNGTVLEILGGEVFVQPISDTFRMQQTTFILENAILFAY
ncbi:hypothetical protein EW146_g4291 [Bondarzewia mesenterica]|uniref:Carboxylic ester hydrolase n=1 Tax=Bondarzewia mesenterica TaxID=1095465 RepID=A0A4S4LWU2_9AGAM|nr:hypothetical protein EW146_g4291 [Bondarzewia mesenterica]